MAPPVIKKVAIAGGTGTVGEYFLRELAETDFDIVLLTRAGAGSVVGKNIKIHTSITVVEVDYSSVESLTNALTGVHALIDVSSPPTPLPTLNLVVAAHAASVYRVIPSYFGIDAASNPLAEVGAFNGKTLAVRKAEELAASSPNFTWTAVACGGFLDWGLQTGFMDIDLAKHTAKLWGNGDITFAVTVLPEVAKATISVLKNLEQTANRKVFIHSLLTTQKHILDVVRDVVGGEWSVETIDIQNIGTNAVEKIKSGTADMSDYIWGLKYGITLQKSTAPWDGSDNKLLGVTTLTETNLKKVIYNLDSTVRAENKHRA